MQCTQVFICLNCAQILKPNFFISFIPKKRIVKKLQKNLKVSRTDVFYEGCFLYFILFEKKSLVFSGLQEKLPKLFMLNKIEFFFTSLNHFL